MNMLSITKIIILAVLALLILYDFIANWLGGVDATISRVILGWSRFDVWIVFGVGLLCGHLLFAQPAKP